MGAPWSPCEAREAARAALARRLRSLNGTADADPRVLRLRRALAEDVVFVSAEAFGAALGLRLPEPPRPELAAAVAQRYPDEASAVQYFERKRWPNGVTCPTCASADVVRGVNKKRRRQLFYCHGCGHQFSVTSGTIMESSKLSLRTWALAYDIIGTTKGPAAQALADALGITYKAAYFLRRRIRAANEAAR